MHKIHTNLTEISTFISHIILKQIYPYNHLFMIDFNKQS